MTRNRFRLYGESQRPGGVEVPARLEGGGRVNKAGLVAEVAKRTGANKAEVARSIDAAMSVIRERVAKGERVALVGFGTFERKHRNQRIARNPRKPQVAITVAARDVPWFTPGMEFRTVVGSAKRRAATKKR